MQHRGAPLVLLDAHVAAGSDRHVEALVRADPDGARPVVSAFGQAHHDAFDRAERLARFGIEADTRDGGALADVEPARVKVHAVRLVQAGKEYVAPVREAVAVCVAQQAQDAAFARHAHEEIARRRGSQETSHRNLGIEAHRVAVGRADPGRERRRLRRCAAPAEQRVHGSIHGKALGEQLASEEGSRREHREHDSDPGEPAHVGSESYRLSTPSPGNDQLSRWCPTGTP